MSLAAEIQALLQADAALMALLTGGVQVAVEISRQLTPEAFDANQEILPCALVKSTTELKAGPHTNSVQTVVSIYLYQRAGSEVIEAAASHIYVQLHERHAAGIWQILFASETPVTVDEALACPLLMQRYNVFRRKA